jgi:hypothetical protein
MAVEKYPNNRMLGHREVIDGKVTTSLPEGFIFHWKSPAV